MTDLKFIIAILITCVTLVFLTESCNRKIVAVATEKAHTTRDIRFGFHIKPPANYDNKEIK